MKKIHPLTLLLDRIRWQWAIGHFRNAFIKTALILNFIAVPVALALHVSGMPDYEIYFFALWPIAFILAVLNCWYYYPTREEAAQTLDRYGGYKDEILSACSFLRTQNANPVAQIQVEEALKKAANIPVRTLIPPARMGRLLTAVMLSLGLLFMGVLPSISEPSPVAKTLIFPEIKEITRTLHEILDDDIHAMADQVPDDEVLREAKSDLARELEKLDAARSDPELALTAISQMEAILDKAVTQYNLSGEAAAFEQLGHALQKSVVTSAAGERLTASEWGQGADELDQLGQHDFEVLTSSERRLLQEALTAAAEQAKQKGQSSLAQNMEQLSKSIHDSDSQKAKEATSEISRAARKLATRAKIRRDLRAKLQMLSRPKAACAACYAEQKAGIKNGQSSSAGQKAGQGTAENAQRQQQKVRSRTGDLETLSGLHGDGPSTTQWEHTDDGEPIKATRPWQEVYQEYRTQVEAALESENIPPGQKEVIQRYFESIRPESETGPTLKTSESEHE
ncbi:MAG: hypothetical protein Q4G68_00450 [Planctomycetia bacterium]|nr:hypothetical protein [Planctomycetia bacterium]